MRMLVALSEWMMATDEHNQHDADAVALLTEAAFALNDLDHPNGAVVRDLLRTTGGTQGRRSDPFRQMVDSVVIAAVDHLRKGGTVTVKKACDELAATLGLHQGDNLIHSIYRNRTSRTTAGEIIPAIKVTNAVELGRAVTLIHEHLRAIQQSP